ncbi:hypothetical protein FOCC_FOCC001062, partial [Frankliniella occidentalis]
ARVNESAPVRRPLVVLLNHRDGFHDAGSEERLEHLQERPVPAQLGVLQPADLPQQEGVRVQVGGSLPVHLARQRLCRGLTGAPPRHALLHVAPLLQGVVQDLAEQPAVAVQVGRLQPTQERVDVEPQQVPHAARGQAEALAQVGQQGRRHGLLRRGPGEEQQQQQRGGGRGRPQDAEPLRPLHRRLPSRIFSPVVARRRAQAHRHVAARGQGRGQGGRLLPRGPARQGLIATAQPRPGRLLSVRPPEAGHSAGPSAESSAGRSARALRHRASVNV